MRICNCYPELKNNKCLKLGNRAFKYIWCIEWIDNACKTTICDRFYNAVNVDDIEHKLFSAMLQNEDWEILKEKE